MFDFKFLAPDGLYRTFNQDQFSDVYTSGAVPVELFPEVSVLSPSGLMEKLDHREAAARIRTQGYTLVNDPKPVRMAGPDRKIYSVDPAQASSAFASGGTPIYKELGSKVINPQIAKATVADPESPFANWFGPTPKDPESLKRWDKYTQLLEKNRKGSAGFLEGINPFDLSVIPWVGSAADVIDSGRVLQTAEKLRDNKPVSDQDVLDLNIYLSELQRQSDATFWGQVGRVMRDSVTFGAEIGSSILATVFSGGLASPAIATALARKAAGETLEAGVKAAATRGSREFTTQALESAAKKYLADGSAKNFANLVTTKGFANRIVRPATKEWAQRALGKEAAEQLAGTGARLTSRQKAAGAAADMAIFALPPTISQVGSQSLAAISAGQPVATVRGNQDNLFRALQGEDTDVASGFWYGVGDQLIENFSESVGGYLGYGLTKLTGLGKAATKASGQQAGKFLDDLLAKSVGPENATKLSTKTKLLAAFSKHVGDKMTKVKDKVSSFADSYSGVMDTFRQVGYDGVIEEMLEERAGDFARGLFGLEGEEGDMFIKRAFKNVWPGLEQLGVEAVAFSAPMAFSIATPSLLGNRRFKDAMAEIRAVSQQAYLGAEKIEPGQEVPAAYKEQTEAGLKLVYNENKRWSKASEVDSPALKLLNKIGSHIAGVQYLPGSEAGTDGGFVWDIEDRMMYTQTGPLPTFMRMAENSELSRDPNATPEQLEKAAIKAGRRALAIYNNFIILNRKNPGGYVSDKTLGEYFTKEEVEYLNQNGLLVRDNKENRWYLQDIAELSEESQDKIFNYGKRHQESVDALLGKKEAGEELSKRQQQYLDAAQQRLEIVKRFTGEKPLTPDEIVELREMGIFTRENTAVDSESITFKMANSVYGDLDPMMPDESRTRVQNIRLKWLMSGSSALTPEEADILRLDLGAGLSPETVDLEEIRVRDFSETTADLIARRDGNLVVQGDYLVRRQTGELFEVEKLESGSVKLRLYGSPEDAEGTTVPQTSIGVDYILDRDLSADNPRKQYQKRLGVRRITSSKRYFAGTLEQVIDSLAEDLGYAAEKPKKLKPKEASAEEILDNNKARRAYYNKNKIETFSYKTGRFYDKSGKNIVPEDTEGAQPEWAYSLGATTDRIDGVVTSYLPGQLGMGGLYDKEDSIEAKLGPIVDLEKLGLLGPLTQALEKLKSERTSLTPEERQALDNAPSPGQPHENANVEYASKIALYILGNHLAAPQAFATPWFDLLTLLRDKGGLTEEALAGFRAELETRLGPQVVQRLQFTPGAEIAQQVSQRRAAAREEAGEAAAQRQRDEAQEASLSRAEAGEPPAGIQGPPRPVTSPTEVSPERRAAIEETRRLLLELSNAVVQSEEAGEIQDDNPARIAKVNVRRFQQFKVALEKAAQRLSQLAEEVGEGQMGEILENVKPNDSLGENGIEAIGQLGQQLNRAAAVVQNSQLDNTSELNEEEANDLSNVLSGDMAYWEEAANSVLEFVRQIESAVANVRGQSGQPKRTTLRSFTELSQAMPPISGAAKPPARKRADKQKQAEAAPTGLLDGVAFTTKKLKEKAEAEGLTRADLEALGPGGAKSGAYNKKQVDEAIERKKQAAKRSDEQLELPIKTPKKKEPTKKQIDEPSSDENKRKTIVNVRRRGRFSGAVSKKDPEQKVKPTRPPSAPPEEPLSVGERQVIVTMTEVLNALAEEKAITEESMDLALIQEVSRMKTLDLDASRSVLGTYFDSEQFVLDLSKARGVDRSVEGENVDEINEELFANQILASEERAAKFFLKNMNVIRHVMEAVFGERDMSISLISSLRFSQTEVWKELAGPNFGVELPSFMQSEAAFDAWRRTAKPDFKQLRNREFSDQSVGELFKFILSRLPYRYVEQVYKALSFGPVRSTQVIVGKKDSFARTLNTNRQGAIFNGFRRLTQDLTPGSDATNRIFDLLQEMSKDFAEVVSAKNIKSKNNRQLVGVVLQTAAEDIRAGKASTAQKRLIKATSELLSRITFGEVNLRYGRAIIDGLIRPPASADVDKKKTTTSKNTFFRVGQVITELDAFTDTPVAERDARATELRDLIFSMLGETEFSVGLGGVPIGEEASVPNEFPLLQLFVDFANEGGLSSTGRGSEGQYAGVLGTSPLTRAANKLRLPLRRIDEVLMPVSGGKRQIVEGRNLSFAQRFAVLKELVKTEFNRNGYGGIGHSNPLFIGDKSQFLAVDIPFSRFYTEEEFAAFADADAFVQNFFSENGPAERVFIDLYNEVWGPVTQFESGRKAREAFLKRMAQTTTTAIPEFLERPGVLPGGYIVDTPQGKALRVLVVEKNTALDDAGFGDGAWLYGSEALDSLIGYGIFPEGTEITKHIFSGQYNGSGILIKGAGVHPKALADEVFAAPGAENEVPLGEFVRRADKVAKAEKAFAVVTPSTAKLLNVPTEARSISMTANATNPETGASQPVNFTVREALVPVETFGRVMDFPAQSTMYSKEFTLQTLSGVIGAAYASLGDKADPFISYILEQKRSYMEWMLGSSEFRAERKDRAMYAASEFEKVGIEDTKKFSKLVKSIQRSEEKVAEGVAETEDDRGRREQFDAIVEKILPENMEAFQTALQVLRGEVDVPDDARQAAEMAFRKELSKSLASRSPHLSRFVKNGVALTNPLIAPEVTRFIINKFITDMGAGEKLKKILLLDAPVSSSGRGESTNAAYEMSEDGFVSYEGGNFPNVVPSRKIKYQGKDIYAEAEAEIDIPDDMLWDNKVLFSLNRKSNLWTEKATAKAIATEVKSGKSRSTNKKTFDEKRFRGILTELFSPIRGTSPFIPLDGSTPFGSNWEEASRYISYLQSEYNILLDLATFDPMAEGVPFILEKPGEYTGQYVRPNFHRVRTTLRNGISLPGTSLSSSRIPAVGGPQSSFPVRLSRRREGAKIKLSRVNAEQRGSDYDGDGTHVYILPSGFMGAWTSIYDSMNESETQLNAKSDPQAFLMSPSTSAYLEKAREQISGWLNAGLRVSSEEFLTQGGQAAMDASSGIGIKAVAGSSVSYLFNVPLPRKKAVALTSGNDEFGLPPLVISKTPGKLDAWSQWRMKVSYDLTQIVVDGAKSPEENSLLVITPQTVALFEAAILAAELPAEVPATGAYDEVIRRAVLPLSSFLLTRPEGKLLLQNLKDNVGVPDAIRSLFPPIPNSELAGPYAIIAATAPELIEFPEGALTLSEDERIKRLYQIDELLKGNETSDALRYLIGLAEETRYFGDLFRYSTTTPREGLAGFRRKQFNLQKYLEGEADPSLGNFMHNTLRYLTPFRDLPETHPGRITLETAKLAIDAVDSSIREQDLELINNNAWMWQLRRTGNKFLFESFGSIESWKDRLWKEIFESAKTKKVVKGKVKYQIDPATLVVRSAQKDQVISALRDSYLIQALSTMRVESGREGMVSTKTLLEETVAEIKRLKKTPEFASNPALNNLIASVFVSAKGGRERKTFRLNQQFFQLETTDGGEANMTSAWSQLPKSLQIDIVDLFVRASGALRVRETFAQVLPVAFMQELDAKTSAVKAFWENSELWETGEYTSTPEGEAMNENLESTFLHRYNESKATDVYGGALPLPVEQRDFAGIPADVTTFTSLDKTGKLEVQVRRESRDGVWTATMNQQTQVIQPKQARAYWQRRKGKPAPAATGETPSTTPEFDKLPSYVPGQKTMAYAGVGSRETPAKVQQQMKKVAAELNKRGYVLQSGGARGADTAFESGAGKKKRVFKKEAATEKTLRIAREIHSNPRAIDRLENADSTWKLMARNTYQIFGSKLDSPVDFVLAWTPDGAESTAERNVKTGGTGQAIDMASRKGIPVINMAKEGWQQRLREVLSMAPAAAPAPAPAPAPTDVSSIPKSIAEETTAERPLVMYADGSDIKGTGLIGYGVWAQHKDKAYEISGTNETPEGRRLQEKFPDAKISNPTMEMLALVKAVETFKDTPAHLLIRQDYKGAVNYDGLWQRSIENSQRAKKPWKAKETYIIDLRDRAVSAIESIEAVGGSVRIEWVRGHQKGGGEIARGNDNADRAAKSREGKNDFLQPSAAISAYNPATEEAETRIGELLVRALDNNTIDYEPLTESPETLAGITPEFIGVSASSELSVRVVDFLSKQPGFVSAENIVSAIDQIGKESDVARITVDKAALKRDFRFEINQIVSLLNQEEQEALDAQIDMSQERDDEGPTAAIAASASQALAWAANRKARQDMGIKDGEPLTGDQVSYDQDQVARQVMKSFNGRWKPLAESIDNLLKEEGVPAGIRADRVRKLVADRKKKKQWPAGAGGAAFDRHINNMLQAKYSGEVPLSQSMLQEMRQDVEAEIARGADPEQLRDLGYSAAVEGLPTNAQKPAPEVDSAIFGRAISPPPTPSLTPVKPVKAAFAGNAIDFSDDIAKQGMRIVQGAPGYDIENNAISIEDPGQTASVVADMAVAGLAQDALILSEPVQGGENYISGLDSRLIRAFAGKPLSDLVAEEVKRKLYNRPSLFRLDSNNAVAVLADQVASEIQVGRTKELINEGRVGRSKVGPKLTFGEPRNVDPYDYPVALVQEYEKEGDLTARQSAELQLAIQRDPIEALQMIRELDAQGEFGENQSLRKSLEDALPPSAYIMQQGFNYSDARDVSAAIAGLIPMADSRLALLKNSGVAGMHHLLVELRNTANAAQLDEQSWQTYWTGILGDGSAKIFIWDSEKDNGIDENGKERPKGGWKGKLTKHAFAATARDLQDRDLAMLMVAGAQEVRGLRWNSKEWREHQVPLRKNIYEYDQNGNIKRDEKGKPIFIQGVVSGDSQLITLGELLDRWNQSGFRNRLLTEGGRSEEMLDMEKLAKDIGARFDEDQRILNEAAWIFNGREFVQYRRNYLSNRYGSGSTPDPISTQAMTLVYRGIRKSNEKDSLLSLNQPNINEADLRVIEWRAKIRGDKSRPEATKAQKDLIRRLYTPAEIARLPVQESTTGLPGDLMLDTVTANRLIQKRLHQLLLRGVRDYYEANPENLGKRDWTPNAIQQQYLNTLKQLEAINDKTKFLTDANPLHPKMYNTWAEAFIDSRRENPDNPSAWLLPDTNDILKIRSRYVFETHNALINRAAISGFMTIKDVTGMPMLMVNPANREAVMEGYVSQDVWREHAMIISDLAKLETPFDPSKDLFEEVSRVYRTALPIISNQVDLRTITSPKTPGIVEWKATTKQSAQVLNQLVQVPFTETNDVLKAAMQVVQWTKLLSVGFSSFFFVALGESSISASGVRRNLLLQAMFNRPEFKRFMRGVKSYRLAQQYYNPQIAARARRMYQYGTKSRQASQIYDPNLSSTYEKIDGWTESWRQLYGDKVADKFSTFMVGSKAAGPGMGGLVNMWPGLSGKKFSDFMFGWFSAVKEWQTEYIMVNAALDAGLNADSALMVPRHIARPITQYVNETLGGNDWHQLIWATPNALAGLSLGMFAPQWTYAAWMSSGGGLLTQKIFKTYYAPGEWPYIIGSLAAMWAVVMHIIPNAMQATFWAAAQALGAGDPEDEPLTGFNEPGREGHIDITPIQRMLPWYKGDPTGQRRLYIQFAKQVHETGVLNPGGARGWINEPWNQLMRKLSMPAKYVLEFMTGRSPGSDWDLEFKGKGFLGLVHSGEPGFEGFMTSRIGYGLQKLIPLSFSTLADNPEVLPANFFAPISKGTSQSKLIENMERVLETYASRRDWHRIRQVPRARANLESLMPQLMEAATKNGYDAKKALDSARGRVLGRYYDKMWRAVNSEDIAAINEAAASIYRVWGTAQGLKSSFSNKSRTYKKPITDEQKQMAIDALEQAYNGRF